MHTILICDDDKDIVSALDIYLTSEGYKTLRAYNGKEALLAVEQNEVHLILMDIMMPELDGIRATAKLREGSNIPIILLTAKSEDSDKILGLNIGADDYITKPFNPLEVIARVKSQLRRYTSLGGADKSPGLLTVGPISLDDSAKQVTVDGEPVALTPIEYNILRLLMTHPGQVFSSAQIYDPLSEGGLGPGVQDRQGGTLIETPAGQSDPPAGRVGALRGGGVRGPAAGTAVSVCPVVYAIRRLDHHLGL